MRCPICAWESRSSPFKSWYYALYQVKRYECESCDNNFNVYEKNGEVKSQFRKGNSP